MKKFNVAGSCNPQKHYMVDTSDKLHKIKKLVDDNCYFVINRPRQYGKTTTLQLLRGVLMPDYAYIRISLESISPTIMQEESSFFYELAVHILFDIRKRNTGVSSEALENLAMIVSDYRNGIEMTSTTFMDAIGAMNEKNEKRIILGIDEIDQACDSDAFISFLSALRDGYLNYNETVFQSVILAGVSDARNLKRKAGNDSECSGEKNSPWNIAIDFNVELGFSVEDIESMLAEYELDSKIGFDVHGVSLALRNWTGGYPFFVSKLCSILSEEASNIQSPQEMRDAWSPGMVARAAEILCIDGRSAILQSLKMQLEESKELRTMLKELLFAGKEISAIRAGKAAKAALLHGFVSVGNNGNLKVSNRIFEAFLYEYLLDDGISLNDQAVKERDGFIINGRLNMELLLERFGVHYNSKLPDESKPDIDAGRIFLSFLKPIINGIGHCYIEPQTRNWKKMDVTIEYLGQQEIVELKILHGIQRIMDGTEQLAEYLDRFNLNKGYVLAFSNLAKGHSETVVDGKDISIFVI